MVKSLLNMFHQENKMIKRLSILIIAVIVALAIAQVAWAAFSGSGSGTAGSPYQITSWAQLAEIKDYLSSYFIFMNSLSSATTGYSTE